MELSEIKIDVWDARLLGLCPVMVQGGREGGKRSECRSGAYLLHKEFVGWYADRRFLCMRICGNIF